MKPSRAEASISVALHLPPMVSMPTLNAEGKKGAAARHKSSAPAPRGSKNGDGQRRVDKTEAFILIIDG